ncbi:MAG: hypothetical protein D3917_14100 [Candidatus Electrothrix sp. AX5]|nr:hypothetical protein [Candidatus Electrothrix sp. AX5]
MERHRRLCAYAACQCSDCRCFLSVLEKEQVFGRQHIHLQ